MTKPSLYAELVAAGATLDHHESDLYVKATPEAGAIIKRHIREHGLTPPRSFVSNVDGGFWWDVAFMYEPFWEAKPQ